MKIKDLCSNQFYKLYTSKSIQIVQYKNPTRIFKTKLHKFTEIDNSDNHHYLYYSQVHNKIYELSSYETDKIMTKAL